VNKLIIEDGNKAAHEGNALADHSIYHLDAVADDWKDNNWSAFSKHYGGPHEDGDASRYYPDIEISRKWNVTLSMRGTMDKALLEPWLNSESTNRFVQLWNICLKKWEEATTECFLFA
jgi:hypothetical protein